MSIALRTARRTSYPALMLFGLVYLAALAVVVSPETFRTDAAVADGAHREPSVAAAKGVSHVLLHP